MDPCQCHWSSVQTIASQYGMDCAPTLYYHSIRKITIKKLKMKKKKEEEENLFPLDLNKWGLFFFLQSRNFTKII